MKRANFFCIVLSYTLFFLTACSKKNDVEADVDRPSIAPECKLVTITGVSGNTTTTFSLSYNNDGEVSVIRQTGGVSPTTKIFTYSGRTIRAVTTNEAGAEIRKDSLQLNSNGFMTFSKSINLTLNRTTVETYTYGNNDQLQKSTSQTDGGAISTSNYTFSNGDLVSSGGNFPIAYTHYTDRSLAVGDYLQLIQLMRIGAPIVRNAHLVKSSQTGSTLLNFIYEFDTDGKIIKLIQTTGSTVETLNYQYECR